MNYLINLPKTASDVILKHNVNDNLKIEIINNIDDELLNKIGQLRFKIYKQESHVKEELIPNGIWLDSEDHKSVHAIIRTQENLILAAARLSIHSNLKEVSHGSLWIKSEVSEPIAYLGKLVVDKEVQKKGLGTRLVKSLMEIAKEKGAKSAILMTSEKLIDAF